MLDFYLLNIDNQSDSNVLLHGKLKRGSIISNTTIRVHNARKQYYVPILANYTIAETIEKIIFYDSRLKHGDVKFLHEKLRVIPLEYHVDVITVDYPAFLRPDFEKLNCKKFNVDFDLETVFLDQKKIRGPGWLQIKYSNASEDIPEVISCDFDDVQLSAVEMEPANLKVMSLVVGKLCIGYQKDPIVGVIVCCSKYQQKDAKNSYFFGVNAVNKNAIIMQHFKEAKPDERTLIQSFCDFVCRSQVNFIVGYDLFETMEFLHHRMKVLQMDLRRFHELKSRCVFCDLRSLSNEFTKTKYCEDLNSLFKAYNLGKDRKFSANLMDLSVEFSNTNKLGNCLKDLRYLSTNILLLQSEMAILEYLFFKAKVTRLALNQSIRLTTANAAALLLQRRLISRKLFVKTSGIAAEIAGGLVYLPRENRNCNFLNCLIANLDFSSFYPSIVIDFYVCFDSGNPFLPKLFRDLIDVRLKTDSECCASFAKHFANTLIGLIGSKYSKVYCPSIYEKILSFGRFVLNWCLQEIETKFPDLSVVYGYTDSLFVKINSTDLALFQCRIAKLLEHLNSLFTEIKVKVGAVYEKLCIINCTKYFGRTTSKHYNFVGFHILNAGFPLVLRTFAKDILSIVLKCGHCYPILYNNIAKQLCLFLQRLKLVEIGDFVFKEKLQKSLDSADDKNVKFAKLRELSRKTHQKYQVNDVISYICYKHYNQSTETVHFATKDQFTLRSDLTIDYLYYLRIIKEFTKELQCNFPGFKHLVRFFSNFEMANCYSIATTSNFGLKVIYFNFFCPNCYYFTVVSGTDNVSSYCKGCMFDFLTNSYILQQFELFCAKFCYLLKANEIDKPLQYTNEGDFNQVGFYEQFIYLKTQYLLIADKCFLSKQWKSSQMFLQMAKMCADLLLNNLGKSFLMFDMRSLPF